MRKQPTAVVSILLTAFILLTPATVIGADMRKGPTLIYPDDNTLMQVNWQLNGTDACTLEWGTDTSYGLGSVNTTEYGTDHQHTYTLPGLASGTKYYYRIWAGGVPYTGSFRAALAVDAEQLKFMAYGDTRSYPADHDNVAEAIVSTAVLDPDFQTFIAVVGDLVNEGREELDWDTEFFDPAYTHIQEMLANFPYHSCMGNHEIKGTGSEDLFLKYFPYPYVADHYWSFDYGPAHFVVVDQYVAYGGGSAQLAWIENDLAASTKRWKFIILHEPAWSAGGHSNNTTVQTYIQPLCELYDVSILFNGHNHYYARAVKNGVQHITTGGGGAPLYAPDPNYPNIVATSKSHHFCKVEIDGKILNFTAVKPNGTVIDQFTITKTIVYVDDDNTAGPWLGTINFPFMHIQDGIDFAEDGDTVLVASGAYVENLRFGGKAITVKSDGGVDQTVIDGGSAVDPDFATAVLFDSGEGPTSVLQGFTLTGGAGTYDGASGHYGGGICCIGASPTIMGNVIIENTATFGGGISAAAGSAPAITNNVLDGNTVSASGGALWASDDSSPILDFDTITGNAAALSGGGIECGTAAVTVKNAILWDNEAPAGPEINGSNLSVSYCDVEGGWTGTGNLDGDPQFTAGPLGAYYLSQPPCQPGTSPCVDAGDPASAVIDGTTRTDGISDSGIVDMGHHYPDPFLRVPDDYATIQEAIDAAADWDKILVAPGTYAENIDFKGKRISVTSSDGPKTTVLDGSQAGSVVLFTGGEDADTVLKGFTVTNGKAQTGGGIYCNGISFPTISGNIVRDNAATYSGGGINGGGTLLNNTIFGNSAQSGGGIFGPAEVVNCTLYDNSALMGGGLATVFTPVTLVNSILWSNSASMGPQIYGIVSVSYSDVEGGWTGAGNLDADPLFVDPGSGDFHLTWLSPCINRGTNEEAPPDDGDGDSRPYMGTVEMGADEFTGIHPLEADAFTLSESSGGTVSFDLDGGTGNAGRSYFLLGGITGTVPGLPLAPGVTLPLNWDLFTTLVYQLANTPVLVDFHGTLGPSGTAAALLDTLGPVTPGYVGVHLYFAYLLYSPFDFVSNPVAVEIVP